MHQYLPNLKIVYVVRHPLDRLVSQWRHLKGRRPDYVAFEDFLSSRHAAQLLIGCSRYYERINCYRHFFPDSQIHCLTFEDLLADPVAVLNGLLSFLGVAAGSEALLDQGALPRVNQAGEKGREFIPCPHWPALLRNRVIELLRPDAEAFLGYVGKPPNYWPW
jgi:hypothetical protein